jgi:hypothetical protein
MQGKRKLAIAATAISIAAGGAATAATAAQAQDEVLTATSTTFAAGGSGWCFKGTGNASFTAAGPATGPYAGSSTEADANVSVSVYILTSRTLALSIPFTISSGSTTITGTVINPPPYAGGSLLCGSGSMQTWGVIVHANGATYTATIQSKGQPAKQVSGTAQVSAAFQFRPQHVLGIAPTVTLLNFPSPLS